MQVALTPEQEEIGAVARAFGERVYPAAELLRIAEAGPVPDLPTWERMAGELGLAGIVVTEPHGGFGGGLLDAVVVSAALGRVLSPVPFLSTAVLSAGVLGAAVLPVSTPTRIRPPVGSAPASGTRASGRRWRRRASSRDGSGG